MALSIRMIKFNSSHPTLRSVEVSDKLKLIKTRRNAAIIAWSDQRCQLRWDYWKLIQHHHYQPILWPLQDERISQRPPIYAILRKLIPSYACSLPNGITPSDLLHSSAFFFFLRYPLYCSNKPPVVFPMHYMADRGPLSLDTSWNTGCLNQVIVFRPLNVTPISFRPFGHSAVFNFFPNFPSYPSSFCRLFVLGTVTDCL